TRPLAWRIREHLVWLGPSGVWSLADLGRCPTAKECGKADLSTFPQLPKSVTCNSGYGAVAATNPDRRLLSATLVHLNQADTGRIVFPSYDRGVAGGRQCRQNGRLQIIGWGKASRFDS